MEVEVKIHSGSGSFSYKMEIESNTRVRDILSRLKIPEEIPKIILINDIHGKQEQILKDGDVVQVIPPVGGG